MAGIKRAKYKFRGRRQRTDTFGKAVSCDGKVRYDTKQQAQAAAAAHDYDYKGDGRHMRAYKCKFKGANGKVHYHFGREPKRV